MTGRQGKDGKQHDIERQNVEVDYLNLSSAASRMA